MQLNPTSAKLKAATLKRIEADYPSVVEIAKRNVKKIGETISGDVLHKYLSDWEDALSDKCALMAIVDDNTTYGLDMWQINPFTGIFSPKERWDILRGEACISINLNTL